MSTVTLGQIVGFKFEKKIPSKSKPGSMTHIISPFADPKFVDAKWLEEQAKIEREARSILGNLPTATTPDNFMAGIEEEEANAAAAPAAVPATASTAEKNDGLEAVRTLAVTKKIVAEGTAPEAIDAKVAEVTGLPVTVENLVPIIVKLTTYNG